MRKKRIVMKCKPVIVRILPVMILLLAVSCITSACGYRFTAHSEGRIRLFITTFKNSTLEPGLGTFISRNIKQALVKRTGFVIVNKSKRADVIVKGSLVFLLEETVSVGHENGVRDNKLTIACSVVFIDTATGKQIADKRFEFSSFYPATGNIMTDMTAKSRAINKLSLDFAESIAATLLAANN